MIGGESGWSRLRGLSCWACVTATQTPPPRHDDHALVAEMRMRISMCQRTKLPSQSGNETSLPDVPSRVGGAAGHETSGVRVVKYYALTFI